MTLREGRKAKEREQKEKRERREAERSRRSIRDKEIRGRISRRDDSCDNSVIIVVVGESH